MSGAQSQHIGPGPATHDPSREPVGELVQQASQQLTELVRGELRLAQAEMREKGKRYGISGGLFGGAAVVGFLTLQALVFTVIAALAVVLPVWASALIVTALLAVVTAVLALVGRKEVDQATPPTPERTIETVKADIAQIKESAHR
ncbi:phage holin family protein [Nocardia otitidiscaviarum]|uniref:phage holin family protein n=1 Tax=Nocardia otitidiscaviarum TaxID=1823 RepID=UPI002456E480|nr:phage holin family protein [Nocardia otitidiscaviarum]